MIQLNEVHVTFPGGMTALHPTSLCFNRGEFTNTDDRYFYGYPFEGKPRSFFVSYSTRF